MSLACLVMDVDGVITDATKTFDKDGNIIGKSFNDHDITALLWLKDQGIHIVWVSGCRFANEAIAMDRGFQFIFVREKVLALSTLGFAPETIAFIGDDNYDVPALKYAGWSFCPSNAAEPARKAAKKILKAKCGEGVVAEAIWEHLANEI